MSLATLLILAFLVALILSLPRWGYSRDWGPFPSGLLGTIVVILVILMLLGRI